MSNFINNIKDELNTSTTENGALGYKTTENPVLDMNFKVASYRGNYSEVERDVTNIFKRGTASDVRNLFRWIFYARDVRGGLGERDLFRHALVRFAYEHPQYVKKAIPLVAEYGRWDDLFCLFNTPVEREVFAYILRQLEQDWKNMKAGKSISLLAKWLPSENASSKQTKKMATYVIKNIGTTPRTYRKLLATLRAKLRIVETQMSANEWGDIEYENVPSKANLLYKDAFFKHDEVRRKAYLDALTRGEAKINASVTFPHEIFAKYENTRGRYIDPALEGMWKALPDIDAGDTLVVCDGSGSMTQPVGGTKVRAIEVSRALALYTASRMKSPVFRDYFITFSANPELVHLTGRTLLDNIQIVDRYNDCSNTNIEAVFNLILDAAQNGLRKNPNADKASLMPKNILIISDMEFDEGTDVSWYCRRTRDGYSTKPSKKLFDMIAQKYRAAGFKLPRMIFWNVNSRTNTIPVKENEMGVALVSGFSVNILKMVMSGKLDPWEALLDVLDSERYEPITKIVKETPLRSEIRGKVKEEFEWPF